MEIMSRQSRVRILAIMFYSLVSSIYRPLVQYIFCSSHYRCSQIRQQHVMHQPNNRLAMWW